METFRYHSAQAKCRRKGSLVVAKWSGPLCAVALDKLRARVVFAAQGAGCMVLRMDSALMMMAQVPGPDASYLTHKSIPGALIVRPDQYDLWADYSRAMALIGVRRCVFLASERDLCRQWVDWQLASHP